MKKYENKIDKEKIINEIRLHRKDISWIGLDIKGTNVKVKIVKSKEQPERAKTLAIIAIKTEIINTFFIEPQLDNYE